MIYLSEFEVIESISRSQRYEQERNDLLTLFEANQIPYHRSNEFSSYELIEKRINESDIIIGLIDDYWTSSTWKLHEVMWPLEQYSSMSGKELTQKDRIVILFWIEDSICIPLKNIESNSFSVHYFSEVKTILENFYQKKLR